ncbi:Xaa-Pro peptidase family protein [bacterium]|nr:Xaa-Pro peptidase family protein [bacterium]
MSKLHRIEILQAELAKQKLDGAFLFYSRDVYYYTGTAQPSYLVVTPNDYGLYVRSGYDFVLEEVFIDVSKIQEERKLEIIYESWFKKAGFKTMATELDILPVNQFYKYQKAFKGIELKDVSPLILEQRKTKDENEIKQLEKACQAIDAGHKAVVSGTLAGLSELEVAAKVENAHRLAEHDGCFFFRLPDFFMSRGPSASGPNLSKFSGVVYSITGVGLGASVPIGPSRRVIEAGDPVMVDIPTSVNGYHADQTRTYFAVKASHQLKDLYEALKEIHETVIKTIRPGMTGKAIYQFAMKTAAKLKMEAPFLSFGNSKKSMLIGHGIGLEVNEPPIISSYSNEVIGENHVIAIEMHMYQENVGVIKLEDTVIIGKDSNRWLTFSSRDLIEL